MKLCNVTTLSPLYKTYIIFFISKPFSSPIINVLLWYKYFAKFHTNIHFKMMIQLHRKSVSPSVTIILSVISIPSPKYNCATWRSLSNATWPVFSVASQCHHQAACHSKIFSQVQLYVSKSSVSWKTYIISTQCPLIVYHSKTISWVQLYCLGRQSSDNVSSPMSPSCGLVF